MASQLKSIEEIVRARGRAKALDKLREMMIAAQRAIPNNMIVGVPPKITTHEKSDTGERYWYPYDMINALIEAATPGVIARFEQQAVNEFVAAVSAAEKS